MRFRNEVNELWDRIRFAAPPTGKLRWQPPQHPLMEQGVVSAKRIRHALPAIPFRTAVRFPYSHSVLLTSAQKSLSEPGLMKTNAELTHQFTPQAKTVSS